ncbi:MAG TPA: protein kinase [Clostridiaceae bacterium]|nr:protein kinase [Clostridiaceae bacterium]
MSDIANFLQSYNEALQQEIAGADLPFGLKEQFTFDSLEKRQSGREVYFVTRKWDGKRAVLRITSQGCGDNAIAEATILSKLDHPAIPKTFGVWEHNGRGFIVREYFEGDDLSTYVRKRGPLSFEMLTDVALRLCDILSYIHGQSPTVIHRDIKPENIIISGRNDVKLIDFGIARDFRQETSSAEYARDTQVAGTRPYMPPEQFGSEQSDNRTDLYALGVVMIFMATGKPDRMNLKSVYPYKGLIPIIEKCIRKDRDLRYKTAAQLKKHILWVRRRLTRKILLCVLLCAGLAVSFLIGLFVGRTQGFHSGIASIMDSPTARNQPFTQEELDQPVTFSSSYIEMAVRLVLNKDESATILRREITSRMQDICIYGTYIIHPSLDVSLIKMHLGKGTVQYRTDDGFRPDRGDISSLEDIPNMYYLQNLTLTSQSISDLSPLTGMKLKTINLSDNYVGNLLPLKDMVMLQELDLCQNPLKDLTPLSRLLSLESLDISQTQVTNLKPLAELTKLETLKLAYCGVKEIGVLAGLSSLREVDLSHTLVTDLSPLIREDDPITVYCSGLRDEVIGAVRDNPGIVLIEE